MALVFRCDGQCGAEFEGQRDWRNIAIGRFPHLDGEDRPELIFCGKCWERIERALVWRGDPRRFRLGDVCEIDTADGPSRATVVDVEDNGNLATVRFANRSEVYVRWAELSKPGGWRLVTPA